MNTKHGILTLTLIFGSLALGAAPSQAQQAGNWELGFGLGATRFDSNLDEDNETEVRQEIRGGYFLTDRFELEAQLSRADAVLGATFDAAMLNAVFNFGSSGAYILAGAGAARLEDVPFSFEEKEGIEEQGLAVQAGIGTRLFFGSARRVAVRLEASVLSEELLEERGEHLSATAGLVWRIGE
ncbi:MAG: outer membrane beta-barrel protein [Acidobacteriota bacterium]